ncbi:MAG: putative peptide zinc metalloprotease protein [Solirubrobacteraceae bacterium]|jgi:putative peptide zinc metalloprotease protein|nr:putative peptide zinc metalloprotease protein [Solirubrobacteraceae bacterium]
MKPRIKLLLLTLVAALSLGAVAHAASFTTEKNNAALAQPTKAGASDFDMAFGMRENDTDVVDEQNTATAYANCDDCRAVAIAFQIVIVQSRPSTITPLNLALAVNEGCSGCKALAIADQFVVGKGEPARLTSRGRSQLLAVADSLLAIEKSYRKLTNAEIEARTASAADKVRAILDAELKPIDGSGDPSVTMTKRVDRAA